MAKSYVGYRRSGRPVKPSKNPVPERTPLRIRPFTGGYSSALSPDQLPQDFMTYSEGLQFEGDWIKRGEVAVSRATLPDTPMYLYHYDIPLGEPEMMVWTTAKLYHYKPSTDILTEVPASPLVDFVATGGSHFQAIVFNDTLYFTDIANPLRQWLGTGSHTAVPTGYAARTLMALNNHIILGNILDGGNIFEHDVVWSSDFTGTVSFTAVGSGRKSFLDTPGPILAMRALNPMQGLIWKGDAIIEARATGDINVPFTWAERVRSSSAGLLFPYALVEHRGSFFFAATDGQVYLYNGAEFTAIGEPIRKDIQGYIYGTGGLDSSFGVFDEFNREYVLMLHSFDPGCRSGFAFHIDRKRWRHIRLPLATGGITAMATLRPSSGFWKNVPQMYSTTFDTKHLLRAEVGLWSLTTTANPGRLYDGNQVDIVFTTADFIGSEDGEEATLLEVSVGVLTRDPSKYGSILVEVSTNGGTNWTTLSQLGLILPLPHATTLYRRFTCFITAMKFRLKLTEFSDGDLRIVSLTAYFAPSKTSRLEAKI